MSWLCNGLAGMYGIHITPSLVADYKLIWLCHRPLKPAPTFGCTIREGHIFFLIITQICDKLFVHIVSSLVTTFQNLNQNMRVYLEAVCSHCMPSLMGTRRRNYILKNNTTGGVVHGQLHLTAQRHFMHQASCWASKCWLGQAGVSAHVFHGSSWGFSTHIFHGC